jgi:AcrR family transcriptional regulator
LLAEVELARMLEARTKTMTRKLPAADRRLQIIEVAMALFSARGFEGTTTREISRAAGVSEAIIFRHFATKEDLYAAIIDFIIQGHSEQFFAELALAMDKRDDAAVFETLAFRILETHRKEPALLRLLLFSSLEGHQLSQLFMESQVRPVYELLSGYIRQRTREGAFRKADAVVLVRGFLGMVSHHALITLIYGDPFLRKSNREMSREFSRMFLQGIHIASSKKQLVLS